jgi:hypothetical protein
VRVYRWEGWGSGEAAHRERHGGGGVEGCADAEGVGRATANRKQDEGESRRLGELEARVRCPLERWRPGPGQKAQI